MVIGERRVAEESHIWILVGNHDVENRYSRGRLFGTWPTECWDSIWIEEKQMERNLCYMLLMNFSNYNSIIHSAKWNFQIQWKPLNVITLDIKNSFLAWFWTFTSPNITNLEQVLHEAGVTFDNSFFDNSFLFLRQFKNRSFLDPVFVHVTGRSQN